MKNYNSRVKMQEQDKELYILGNNIDLQYCSTIMH